MAKRRVQRAGQMKQPTKAEDILADSPRGMGITLDHLPSFELRSDTREAICFARTMIE